MIKKTVTCNFCNDAIPATPKLGSILVHGAKEHNLKNICFEIPKGKLVALTGPSGSGKSSIANDILQKECIRQYLESLGMVTDHIEKAKVDKIMGLSPSIGVTQRVTDFNPRSTVGTRSGILTILRNLFAVMGHQPCPRCKNLVKQPLQDKHKLTTIEVEKDETDASSKKRKISYFDCPYCGQQLEKLKMAHFSYNALEGACTHCKGIGQIITLDVAGLLNTQKTIRDGGVDYWNEALAKHYESVIHAASIHYNFSFDTTVALKDYTQEQLNFLLYGITFPDFAKTYKGIQAPKKVSDGNFEGLIPHILNLYKKNPENAGAVKKYIINEQCTECNGSRLARLGRQVTVGGKTMIDVTAINLNELLVWIYNLEKNVSTDELTILTAFLDALKERTAHLIEVGLDYLTLNRTLPSLSAGESQRVRLASLLGSGLSGVLYVLDEPTTGLHPFDNTKLLKTIRKIQEAGNTVLIIEHDMDVIKDTDYILDIGPGGGNNGGEIVATGTPSDIMACAQSITGKYLDKKVKINLNPRVHTSAALIIRGAREHNLKNIDVSIPIQQLIVLTGVSGSGKSTFLFDIVDKAARKYFYDASEIPGKFDSIEGLDNFNRVVTVNQTTIGNTKSSRSNIATYTKLFDLIRDLFATLPQAKALGFGSDKFSFNTSDQRCQNCNGAGTVEVDMTFMPDIETICPSCNGMRFNEKLLTIQFQGHSISDILDMTIKNAMHLFRNEKKIFALLDFMDQVGLNYLKLGQSTSTLSGGEAQRIKLATELAKSETGNTLYLLDEPTTGLNPQEVEKLIIILKKLVLTGNTVIVIEHNIDVMCNADTIIDFGPGGGIAGGNIVATGTPQEIAANKNSLTGQCLLESIYDKSTLI